MMDESQWVSTEVAPTLNDAKNVVASSLLYKIGLGVDDEEIHDDEMDIEQDIARVGMRAVKGLLDQMVSDLSHSE